MNAYEIEKRDLVRFSVLPGDVLMNEGGDRDKLGRGCVWSGEFNPCVHQNHVFVIRCGPSISSRFLTAWTRSAVARRYFITAGSQTTNLASINKSAISQLPIPLPPTIAEQEVIAAVFDDVDALIGILDRLIAKKCDLRQAAMQQLLTGQTRLPGFRGDWEKKTLGEIGECVIGLTYQPEDVVEHGTLVLRASNIQNSQLSYEDCVFVNKSIPPHLFVREGDILVCVRNGSRALIGKCVRLGADSAGHSFGAFMSVYRTPYSRFLVHVFQSGTIQKQIHENIGATINQITNKDMKSFRVELPPVEEQAAIAEVLSDMDEEIAALENRRDKTRLLKEGMMQELLTGRKRLICSI
jgi:type I restriction enzyme S subunit